MQSISPEIIFRGNGAWEKSLTQIKNLTKTPLVLGRSLITNNITQQIYNDLLEYNFEININGTLNLLEACRLYSKKKFYYIFIN